MKVCKDCNILFKPTLSDLKCYRRLCSTCRYKREMKRHKKYLLEKPWMKHLSYSRNRCINTKDPAHKSYIERGIKACLTSREIETLWKRDKAYKLKNPSLDRINNNGNYEFKNCRFIEMYENQLNRVFKSGENHPMRKYTRKQIELILNLHSKNFKRAEISRLTKVNLATVHAVIANRQWTCIGGTI